MMPQPESTKAGKNGRH